jgi:hypothetical protein
LSESHTPSQPGPPRTAAARRTRPETRGDGHTHGHSHAQHAAPAAAPAPAIEERPSAPFDPAPLKFKELITEPALLDALDQRGFEQTTPVQSAVCRTRSPAAT